MKLNNCLIENKGLPLSSLIIPHSSVLIEKPLLAQAFGKTKKKSYRVSGKAMRQRLCGRVENSKNLERKSYTFSEFAFNLEKIVCMAAPWSIEKVKDLGKKCFQIPQA